MIVKHFAGKEKKKVGFQYRNDELAEDESVLDEDACSFPPPQLYTK